jgi:N-terminal acetyltransferase B complex non-catalytic subunit
MNVRHIQHDTLSHLVLSRASTFSLAATGDLTYSSECLESSQIYLSNSQEVKWAIHKPTLPKTFSTASQTSEFIVRAFTSERYSQIPDLIAFEERLDNSLQRDATKVEHVRMRLAHEQLSSELVDMELIELKFIFDRG